MVLVPYSQLAEQSKLLGLPKKQLVYSDYSHLQQVLVTLIDSAGMHHQSQADYSLLVVVQNPQLGITTNPLLLPSAAKITISLPMQYKQLQTMDLLQTHLLQASRITEQLFILLQSILLLEFLQLVVQLHSPSPTITLDLDLSPHSLVRL